MNRVMTPALCLALLAAAPAWSQTATPSAGGRPPAAAPSQADRHFVEAAAIGGLAEVELGVLAEKNAGDPAVREFGRWMATDHGVANQALAHLAQQAGITAPTAPDAAHQSTMQQLQGLHGASFDRPYVTAQVADHEQTLSLFRNEAQSGQNRDLRNFAATMAPVLQQHLVQAQELASLLQAEIGSGSSSAGKAGRGTR